MSRTKVYLRKDGTIKVETAKEAEHKLATYDTITAQNKKLAEAVVDLSGYGNDPTATQDDRVTIHSEAITLAKEILKEK